MDATEYAHALLKKIHDSEMWILSFRIGLVMILDASPRNETYPSTEPVIIKLEFKPQLPNIYLGLAKYGDNL
jgi:hypothetical protein